MNYPPGYIPAIPRSDEEIEAELNRRCGYTPAGEVRYIEVQKPVDEPVRQRKVSASIGRFGRKKDGRFK